MSGRYGLEIRAMTPADAPGVAELLRAGGLAAEPAVLVERLATLKRSGQALLALEWGPPSGIIVLHWLAELTGAPSAEASLLLVAPEERRRGIGRLLLKAGAQAARSAGCGALRLRASAGGDALLAFCRASGFVEDGTALLRPLRKGG